MFLVFPHVGHFIKYFEDKLLYCTTHNLKYKPIQIIHPNFHHPGLQKNYQNNDWSFLPRRPRQSTNSQIMGKVARKQKMIVLLAEISDNGRAGRKQGRPRMRQLEPGAMISKPLIRPARD